VMILTLAPTTTTFSPEAVFAVALGVLHSTGGFPLLQAARANTLIAVTNSAPGVAQLRTAAGVGQNRTITIPANEYTSGGDLTSGGVAFDPLGDGLTTVTASSPGFDNSVLGSVNVTVTTPRLFMTGLPFKVGAGLQSNFNPFCCTLAAQLEGSDHAGITVRIRSLSPAIALIAADESSAGAEFVDISVPAGSSFAPYYIQGVSPGTASISATATGFLTGSGSVEVVQPALQIESLPTSMSATDPSAAFTVAIGVPVDGGPGLAHYQATRPGMEVTATVTNSNANVAQLVTLAGGAQSRTIVISAGQSRSAFGVAAGGVDFDPLAAGQTSVSASIPGFSTTTAGTVTVDVTGGTAAAPLSTTRNGSSRRPRGGG
jgi:large repetitive protein